MSTLEQRCLMGSAAVHAGLVAALLVASLVAARRAFDPSALPPIELVSLEGVRITDGIGAGGGTPTPPPPAPPSPPQRPVDPPLRLPPPPTREAPRPQARAEAPPEPKSSQERAVQVSPEVKKSQDVDASLKGKARAEKADADKKPRKIEVAQSTSRSAAKDLAAERAAEAAESRRQAALAAKAAQERWSKAVGGIHSKLSESLSGETTISVPGPGGGGEVWIGYATYLKSFYEVRWRRPSSLPAPVAYVGVSITVARDGRLLRAEVLDKSGIRELDNSVNEVIQRYRQLEPLPSGSTDSERTFRIKFRLEGGTQ